MLSLLKAQSSRTLFLFLSFWLAMASGAYAGSVQSTPTLPPTNGAYVTNTFCQPNLLGPQGVCVENAQLFGFTGTTSTFDSSGQEIDSNVTFTADLYSYVGGVIGPLLGPVTLTGGIGILYAGRSTPSQLGTFNSTLTELDVTGTFHGPHGTFTLVAGLNPNLASTGQTTISEFSVSPALYEVDSYFDAFPEFSINGGPFMLDTVPRVLNLVATPEPGSGGLTALGLLGIVAVALRRRIGAGVSC